jgi:lipoprotein-anchoring transpeptidase ErfK/SrfK
MRQNESFAVEARKSGWQARLYAVATVMILAVAEAHAQNQPAGPLKPREGLNGAPPKREVIVSIPDRKLALIEDGQVIKIYPVAVGAPVSPSPTGEFKIVNRVTNPTYYHKGEVIPAGASNPVGTRWIGLSQKGYGIHGTNAPRSIGKAASHGCIRMAKANLEELFEIVRPGDTVSIRAERDEQTAELFGGEPTVLVAAAQHPATIGLAAGGQ